MTSLTPFTKKKVFPLLDDYSPLLEDKFVRLIENKSGIVLDHIKRRDIKQNITACMEENGEESFNRFYETLTAHQGHNRDLRKLINFITINETFFFRVPEHFTLLEKIIVPKLRENKNRHTLTVWSAGASSGEEVYSIIITLLEIPGLKESLNLEILGTDINEDMLYIADKAVYSGRTLAKVPSYILDQYFEPFLTDRFRVKHEVKQYARFHYLNLAQPFHFDSNKPDVIFFRNVLIYFERETTRKIIDAFYHLLPDDGYLILGPSETLWELSDQFQLEMYENAYIYRKIPSNLPNGSNGADMGSPSDLNPACGTVQVRNTENPQWNLQTSHQGNHHSGDREGQVSALPHGVPQNVHPGSYHSVHHHMPADAIFPSIPDRMRIKLDEASLAIALADYQKANELLDDILGLNPENKQAILLKMTLMANQLHKDELLEFAEQVKQIYPIFPELHFLIGRLYESLNAKKEAVKEYHKVLFIDPGYLSARERLLRIFDARGEEAAAQREARNILDALNSGKYKNLEFSVGDPINKDQLYKLCCRILN